MGFKDARKKAIEALKKGEFHHESRGNIDDKNLLLTGKVSVDDVIGLLRRCRGDQHSSSPHYNAASVDVHVFKPVIKEAGGTETRWYIKLYFLDPDTWFNSVHQS